MERTERKRRDNSDRAPRMVREGYSISLTTLRQALRDAEALLSVRPLLEKYGDRYVSLLCQFGDQGTAVLPTLLSNEIQKISDTVVNIARVTVTVVKSAFLYGGFTPTLDHCDTKHQKILYSPGHPVHRQRILAASSFGPTKKARYTHVAISAENDL